MNEGKIIIIDENKLNREFLQYYFAEKFSKLNLMLNIITIGNCYEAIEILKKFKQENEKIKAILMNIKISKINETELWKKIKIEIDRNIPILFYQNVKDESNTDYYLTYAYNINGDDLYELDIKLEKAVKHYDLMNENIFNEMEDRKNYSVKEPKILKTSKNSSDFIEELLENYIGNPENYLMNFEKNISYKESVKLIEGKLNNINIPITNDLRCSKIVCFGLIKKYKYEVFNSLDYGGLAIFVLPFSGIGLFKIQEYKKELNKAGFIVEGIYKTIEKKTIFEVRKPIVIEDESSGLILIEAQNDKHIRDYYYITRDYFDLLTREIDMSFDQVSTHFLVYRKNDMLPISTSRIIPKTRIKLPIEYGLIQNNKNYEVEELNSVEVSHLANLNENKAKERSINFRMFGDALKMLFSSILKYCIHNKMFNIYLSFDERNKSLEKLYSKLGFRDKGVKIYYE